jgi:hypothetical protein
MNRKVHPELSSVRPVAMMLILSAWVAVQMSCAYPYGRMNYKPLHVENLALGMTKQEAQRAVGRPPSSVVGSRSTGDHTVEVWHYMKAYFNWYGGEDTIQYEYYLYFLDGRLVEWGKPGVWENEADRLLRVHLE